jgi:hypothetical protein
LEEILWLHFNREARKQCFHHIHVSYAPATSPESAAVTLADDTAVVAMESEPAITSHKLQTNLLAIQNWFNKWRMKANGSK